MAVGVASMLAAPAAARTARAAAVTAKADEVADRAGVALADLMATSPDQPVGLAVGAMAAYVNQRHALAAVVADRTGVDANELDAAWTQAGGQRMTAVLAALTQVGTPYRYASAEPRVGFDCSGLTSWAWGIAGVALDHSSSGQLDRSRAHPQALAAAGDLVGLRGLGHVAIYLGVGDAVVHAPNSGHWVEVIALTKRLDWFVYPAG